MATRGNRLQGGEETADGEPVFRRADPEVVVTQAEDAGAEHQRDFDVQPGLDDATAHAHGLDQAVGHQTADQDFPGGLDPKVDHPPPPVLVHGDVRRVVHAGQIQTREGDQIEHEDAGDAGELAFGEGGGDVVEERQDADDDADVGPARRFDVLAAFIDQPDRLQFARSYLHQQIDQHDDHHGQGKDPEDQVSQRQPSDRCARFVFQHPVHRADEAEQQPDHHGVDMQHAVDREVEDAEQEVRVEILNPGEQAEQDLRTEQGDGDGKVLHRQFLAAIQIGAGEYA
jgi:hypothetical protein